MNKYKAIGKALLFPPLAVLVLLLPVATIFLVYAMLFLDSGNPFAIASYVVATYTLTVFCFRIPNMLRFAKAFRNENKYMKRWRGDVHLRVNVSLYGSLLWNVAYSIFQLCLGWYHASFWYYSLAAYYIFLAVMRFLLVGYTKKYKPGENMYQELKTYRNCGMVFLILNLALTLMIFFMIYWNRTFHHHEITTIAMAAYTFTTFTTAIVNLVKYRKYQSPVLSASKAITFAAACVSMITLTATMLTTFGDDMSDLFFRRLMLSLLGSAVSIVIIIMAIYMIVRANRELKKSGELHERTEQ